MKEYEGFTTFLGLAVRSEKHLILLTRFIVELKKTIEHNKSVLS